MRIERIGLSLDSIAEERRRQHREHPDDDAPFDGASDDSSSATAQGAAARAVAGQAGEPLDSPADASTHPKGAHRDDPTARLRVDLPEEYPRRNRQHVIEAFTGYDAPPDHTLADTDL